MFGQRKAVLEMPANGSAAAGGVAQGYGGFWIRFLAYLADWAIITFVLMVLIVPAAFLGAAGAMIFAAVALVGPFLYFAVMQASERQATFGKDLLGLKVAHAGTGARISFVRSLGRELAKIISGLILALGFIIAAFTNRKQGLHDFIAATVVVREKSARVVAAIVVVIAGLAIPFVALPLMMGAFMGGMMLAVMGPLLGGMMGGKDLGDASKAARPVPQVTQPAAKAPPHKPAPPVAATEKPAVATALSAAEYDKLLSQPLSGLEKPSSARAGPALLQLDTFFGDSMWLKVMLPPIPNLDHSRASVTINRILDAKDQDRYDRDSAFEKEFFRKVNLGETKTGVPHFSGNRSVRVKKGTTEPDVQKVEGVLNLSLPIELKVLSLGAADVGKEQVMGPAKFTLKSLQGQEVSYAVAGAGENFLGSRGFDVQGAVVPSDSISHSGGDFTVKFRAPVARIEFAVASSLLKREYPFTLVKGQVAPPAITASVPAPAAPAPAPEKPVAVAVAPVPAPKLATAPVMKVEAPSKLAPQAAPSAEDKPKAARRVAKRKPAVPAEVAEPAPPPPPRMAKYNDVMTAVMSGDRAGAAEALELGFWADRPDSNGVTPLMVAAMNGDAAMTQLLLKHGADPNRRGPGGSVLDYAGRSRDSKVLELLKKAGAR